MGRWNEKSPRIRPAVRKVAFTDRVGGSVAVMKASFVLGSEAPEPNRNEYSGSGRRLEW